MASPALPRCGSKAVDALFGTPESQLQPLGQMKLHPDTCEPEDLLNGADAVLAGRQGSHMGRRRIHSEYGQG